MAEFATRCDAKYFGNIIPRIVSHSNGSILDNINTCLKYLDLINCKMLWHTKQKWNCDVQKVKCRVLDKLHAESCNLETLNLTVKS